MSNQESRPISWKKTTGTFILHHRDGTKQVINQGQVFLALEAEIPLAFRDTIKLVDPEELQELANPPLDITDPGYQVVPRGKLPGRFNVVDGQGKVMNEQALTADEAAELLESLGG